MSSQFDNIVFKDKTFSSILEEIYNDSKIKEIQINTLIKELQPLVSTTGDAALIVPLIAKYLEMGIQNSDNLIKMASIVQRSFNKSSDSNSDFILNDEEKQQLLEEVKKINTEKIQITESPKLKGLKE